MPTIEHNGRSYEVDEDGFLLDSTACDAGWTDYVQKLEGIPEVNGDHQKIMERLQDFHKRNGVSPMVRLIPRVTGYPLKRIYELFPSGPGKGACKIAGLPKPFSIIPA